MPGHFMTVHPLSNEQLTLNTARLTLRPYCDEDIDLYGALLRDPMVMRYLGEFSPDKPVEDEHAKVIHRGAGGRLGVWTALLKTTGEKLGNVVLIPLPIDLPDTDWTSVVPDRYPDAEIEAGYMFRQSAWGKGYATEACKRIIQFGFEMTPLDDIVAVTDTRNVASGHVLRKSGLRDDGLRHAYQEQVCAFSISRADWQAKNA